MPCSEARNLIHSTGGVARDGRGKGGGQLVRAQALRGAGGLTIVCGRAVTVAFFRIPRLRGPGMYQGEAHILIYKLCMDIASCILYQLVVNYTYTIYI